jgi:dUTP pyrophosphatase
MKPIQLQIKHVHPNSRKPFRKRLTDAGHDLYSIQDAIVPPRGYAWIETGIAIAAPSGTYYTIEGRSSLAQIGIVPMRGIIDGCFTGDLRVMLNNHTDEPYKVAHGDRIAQIVVHRLEQVEFREVENFDTDYSIRGEHGFGSSGK